jgi:MFS family permease
VTAQPADENSGPTPAKTGGALAPLRNRTFRVIWLASILSNFGTMIQGVGAAWEMTRLTNAPEMVALVQTATTLPLMLFTVPAGAVADVFDRRKVAIIGLLVSMVAAISLTALAAAGLTTPWLLLAFCVWIGAGTALYSPAWQSSISDQVGREQLPAAVALGSLSYSVARSFGPALGGAIVASAGATIAFGVNAVSFVPVLLAFFLWKRPPSPSTLPRERIDRAIISGARFVLHSAPARRASIRAFAVTFCGAALSALLPLIAKNLLHGDATTFGLLLGAYGIGSVGAALLISPLRARFSPDALNRAGAAATGAAVLVAAFSSNVLITAAALFLAGACWVVMLAMLNVSVQLSSPRWVTGRALAWYQALLTGGIALGAWMWGYVAAASSLPIALMISGGLMLLMPVFGMLLPLPVANPLDATSVDTTHEPPVGLPITPRSGPVVLEIDYEVGPEQAAEFTGLMARMQSARLRNGAFDWSLARDIANPLLWTERYSFPTWGDYLRQRTRFTEADHQIYSALGALRVGTDGHVRRKLERPPGAQGRKDQPPADFMPPQTP